MKINFIYRNEFRVNKETRKYLRDLIVGISKAENSEISSVNLIFCSDDYIRDFNKEYLNHDYATDIITFHDMTKEDMMEGELLISTETVSKNSKRFKESFEDELSRVLIHGVLHLCGYNDKTRTEKTLMKKKENYYLKNNQKNAGKSN